MNRPRSIALIDLSYVFKRRWHTLDGSPRDKALAAVRDVEYLENGVDAVVLCRDAPPYSARLAIHPEYKAHRPRPEPEEITQKRWVLEELTRRGFPMAYVEGQEADDVIATLAAKYSEWCDDVRIVCPDKDAAQCVTEQCKQYIPPVAGRDWEVRGPEQVKEKFGVIPQLMPLFQALKGDREDNVPGVPGIGDVKAAQLANKYGNLKALAEGLAVEAAAPKVPAYIHALGKHWEDLRKSLALVTLNKDLQLDADALLVKREAQPPKEDTTMKPANDDGAAFEDALRGYQDKLPALQQVAAKDAELLEKEYDRERERNDEHDAVSNEPAEKESRRVEVPRPSAIVPAYTQTQYGIVTKDLQPLDLESASTLAQWFAKGELYHKKYKNAAQIFTIIAKARELGIKVTVALDNYHMVEGKPTASADLIRALCEKDPSFEYLMPLEMSATRVLWEGKRKGYPKPVQFAYTIEEARQAGLIRKGQYGGDSNWITRAQDMLNKTAGSKLARILWPAACLGLYCPEEFGYTAEELDLREAA